MTEFGIPTWDRQRLAPLVTVVPYVILAILIVFTVIAKWSDGDSLVIDLILCAVTAAWMLWMFTLHPAWRVRRGVMAVFIGGLIALMAALVLRDSWFGFFSPAGYFYAFRLFRWPGELGAVAGVAIIAATAQASGLPNDTALGWSVYTAVLVANVVPMCGLAWLGHLGDQHDARREQALAEVNEANRRLEAALSDNAALQERLVGGARVAGVLDERARMAREIHDTLAQGLTGIITQLQAAEHADADPSERRRHVAAATALARQSLTEARRSVQELRPEPLESARLGDALAGVVERWAAQHGIEAVATFVGDVRPLPPEAEVALLRAGQEALVNVARHARASHVTLTLSYLANEIALDVRDDGRGFDPDRPGSAEDGGFGLVAMRQRIEDLHGTLQIETEPGAGTAISAHIPLSGASLSGALR